MQIGKYEVRGEIARGGMGAVLRAWDPEQRREVALKLVLEGGAASPTRRKRFRTECQALERVRHPNVVALLDHGEHDGVPWLAMELIEGTSLAERVRRGGALEPREAARVTKLLAEALRHLHENGVLHRDVKPANVLVTPEGRTLLTDFGLAKDLQAGLGESAASVAGQFLGTPGYLPPEQARGAEVDARADVYGLGATLYAMLVARPPYDASDLVALVDAMQRPPLVPSSLREGIDHQLEAICLRCLEHDPARRFPSAEALAAALGEWIRGDEPPAVRGAPGLLLAAGLGVLGLAGVAVWLALLREPAATPPAVDPGATPASPATRAPALPPAPARPGQATLDELRAAAEAAMARKDPAAAAAAWTQYLRLEPDARVALQGRSIARAQQSDALGALEDIGRVIELDPRDVDMRLERAEILRRRGDLAGARTDLDAAVVAGPNRSTIWLSRALLRRDQGDEAGALADLDRSLELDPDRLLALESRAELHQKAGRLDAALRDLERLARLRPDLPAAWIRLSQVHEARGDLESTRADLDRACRADPRSAGALVARGLFRLNHQDAEGARADLQKALQLDPTTPSAARLLAHALARLDELEEARAVLDEALQRQPSDADLLGYRGYIRHQMGDLEGALADCSAALERDAEQQTVWLTRGVVRLDMGDKEGGLADTDRALALDPEDIQAWVNRGSIHDAMGDTEAAIRDFTKAIEVGPDSYRAWVGRGQLHFRLKHYPEARDDLERAAALVPDDLQMVNNRGLARCFAGDKEGAREDFRRVRAADPDGAAGQRAVVLLRDLLGEGDPPLPAPTPPETRSSPAGGSRE